MITRFAIFEGHIPFDRRSDFQCAVINTLIPAVEELPSIGSVSVSFAAERDAGAPEIAMFLVTTYPNKEALAQALVSQQRLRAQDITEGIFETFGRCRVHHHITTTVE
ncbi:hypothetical protein [Tateyamaria sp. ANG-S1]|uniref:hypothetical protein n=1 Tax=Tateyamaria sp. ANG-S1 TaxID=1577905 RepID=UPI00057FB90A|nr:hypothetical protein [Tateyamaria sp. ANG-S1]KIC49528.1 hypothetical protein RA29_07475 [Tateyamaria sp. ANG-S1]